MLILAAGGMIPYLSSVPPEPPIPPLTPPRGPGGPKMAKMHSLKSIDDNLCQKSHFWGVKKIDLFFHSECTTC